MTADETTRETIEKLISDLSRKIGKQAEARFVYAWKDRDFDHESPIEDMMAIGLRYVLDSTDDFGWYESIWTPSKGNDIPEDTVFEGFIIRPQQRIGPYRADFFVSYRFPIGPTVKAIIECDGHQFHHATKKQVQRDKVRDRYFQSRGLLVLRYTGSEIYRNAVGCASDALATIYGLAEQRFLDGEYKKAEAEEAN